MSNSDKKHFHLTFAGKWYEYVVAGIILIICADALIKYKLSASILIGELLNIIGFIIIIFGIVKSIKKKLYQN